MADLFSGLTAQGRTIALVVGALLATLVVGLIAYRFHRSDQKDRWVDRVATVLVLAWTSEGMWELATKRMHLPTGFVIASFFVVEAMMVASAMRANAYRAKHGIPGRSGYAVWALAGIFGTIVAIGTGGSLAGFLLRLALPLAATMLWWNGLTAERDTDTPQMLAERERRAAEREGTWAITPRMLLVRLKIMKPGKVTTTEAQRQLHVRRMIATRVLIHRGGSARAIKKARLRLGALAETATSDMVDEVYRQVRQTVLIEDLTDGTVDRNPRSTLPTPPHDTPGGHPTAPVPAPLGGSPATPPANGADTPARNPATPPITRVIGTPEPRPNGKGADAPEPPLTSDGTLDDTPLLAELRDPARVPRNPDGTVPVKRAMRVLGVGRTRAVRLLDTLSLRTVPDPDDDGSDTPGDTPGSKGSADDEERHPEPPINGRHLVAATSN